MAEKEYDWVVGGVELLDHTRRKHKILSEYLVEYLLVRCCMFRQSKFRFAVIDGFSGSGRYSCGTAGSPLIFIEQIFHASREINLRRKMKKMDPVRIECLIICNDKNEAAIQKLKEHIAIFHQDCRDRHNESMIPLLHFVFYSEIFEKIYPKIKSTLQFYKLGNVLFNLDQCGYKHVPSSIIVDILHTFNSPEIFHTFAIETLFTFLNTQDKLKRERHLAPYITDEKNFEHLEGMMSKVEWLGRVEKLVFDNLGKLAPYTSPFSIHNEEGWRYWLVHYANNFRARQVYNDVLHQNSSMQAHYGRAGLDMLMYDPSQDKPMLSIFDENSREISRRQLMEDVPKAIAEDGDVITVGNFYAKAYSGTPAHSIDIDQTLIGHPDIEVVTPNGGLRRKANSIKLDDVLRLSAQKSFFPMFFMLDIDK